MSDALLNKKIDNVLNIPLSTLYAERILATHAPEEESGMISET